MAFKDHFSRQAAAYGRHRPGYPDALFQWLAARAPARHRAWDCATGNGQAARGLARYFAQVEATDASPEQLARAPQLPGVTYRVADAEASGLDAHGADLIVVAQAAHWFDPAAFYREVRRVARPGALLALWCYGLGGPGGAVDPVLRDFYARVVGPYWPPERRHIETGYRDLPFPFPTLAPPPFEMAVDWQIDDLLGYLGSWSAVQRYREALGHDPVRRHERAFRDAWGDAARRRMRWPLHLRAGQVGGGAATGAARKTSLAQSR